MDIESVVVMLDSNEVSTDLIEIVGREQAAARLSSKKIKYDIENKVSELIGLMGSNEVYKAKMLARALVIYSPDKSMAEMRSAGAFRCSKYKFKTSVAQAVVKDLIAFGEVLKLDFELKGYLDSVSSLLAFGSKVRQIHAGVVEVVKGRRKFVVKTLLANLEILFATRMPDFNKTLSSDDVEHYSNEDLAEAFSYILRLHRDEFGVRNEYFQHVDESAVSTQLYWGLLIDAAKICNYKEAELLLDGFPFKAVRRAGDLVVASIDPRVEKSIRLGYIQTIQQMLIRRKGLEEYVFNERNENRPASIKKFAEEFYDAGKEKIIFVNPLPLPRYVLGFVMDPELFKPFSTDGLFEEEIEALVQLGIENYDYGSLKDVDIRDGITALDIMKVQRLFRFFSVIYQRAIADHVASDKYTIALRSVLPTFSESLLEQIVQMVLPGRDSKKALSLISLELSSADHIDIQYTPLIKLNGHYIVAPALVANSNLARNIFCGQKIKHPFPGDIDPMQNMLFQALESQGFSVVQELKINFQKREIETDIVAFKDGKLFLIECKNPYHPCNVHEMRNSFDHVSYGARQLSIRKEWLGSVEEQKRLFAAAKFKYESVDQIYTCVAVANRVFNGCEVGGHPVRQGHELINMISSGVVNIAGVTRRVWEGLEFKVEDLISYLNGDTTVKDCMASFVDIEVSYDLKGQSLTFGTYVLDMERLVEISKRYPEVS
ncbi:hypothetical protein CQ009_29045 [Pseudomonas sp. MYb2]|uniref:hypothetical protein n=1 Tax=unclassified Pseudomonas TaxID=196821 RepID=UPI0006D6B973|nr:MULTISPECIES: hypothetical protein [unclassified Pseudomonas]KPG96535.1 hypothetical protein AK821_14600 [Pseudomonas sp. RIT-PI-r]PRB48726.1 hypothetical protein CQ025_15080 [Pseudomonas sp. MYb3]PRC23809.1 hypothetical protein CQ009_29045 [Pseudomonas sp. MYb2]